MVEQAKYYFGLRDNKIINISSITPVENGENCGCVCPGCGRVFIANTLGKRQLAGERIKYFSHKIEGEFCDINKYHETVLHYLAKECFREIAFIQLPNDFIGWDDAKKYYSEMDLACLTESQLSEFIAMQEPVCACETLEIDKNSITLEKQIQNNSSHIQPDVVLKDSNGNVFYIEICVKHPSSKHKISFYERYNLNAIEITLNLNDFDFEDEHIKEKLKSVLTYNTKNKTWLWKTDKNVYVKNLLIKQHEFFNKSSNCFGDDFYCVVGVEEVDYIKRSNQQRVHGYKIFYSYKSSKCIFGRMTDTAWISDGCLASSGGALPQVGDYIKLYYSKYSGNNFGDNRPSKFIIKQC